MRYSVKATVTRTGAVILNDMGAEFDCDDPSNFLAVFWTAKGEPGTVVEFGRVSENVWREASELGYAMATHADGMSAAQAMGLIKTLNDRTLPPLQMVG